MTATPILVGISQLEQREQDPFAAAEPLALMAAAARAAAQDSGNEALLAQATSVRVVRGIWPYKNPAQTLKSELGLDKADTWLTPYGGNMVQSLVNRSALDIQNGTHNVILITGAECGASQARARRADKKLRWEPGSGEPDHLLDAEVPMSNEAEMSIGLRAPIQMYPIFENAERFERGESIPDHAKRISQLWARFSAVASNNPHAWLRDAKTAEEIRTPGGANRPVSFPYPKFMNSNSNVDQGAALIMTSAEHARACGIPEDKWVYLWSGTDAHDTYFVSHRDKLNASPAIRIAGNRALELAGVEASDLDMVDLYSCFPIAVQVAARELGLDETRQLTVTGGLTWAGGPLNNYVMHSIARTAELLREQRNATGLVTANGGFLTKHAFGVYSAQPPAKPYQHANVQDEVDALPTTELAENYSGEALIESYSVMYGADGVDTGFLACKTPAGQRCWAAVSDKDVLQAMTEEEYCGRSASVSGGSARIS
ncbi:MAG: acetyl-CoA acetyltransferase [Pseudomonadaceae bacterium]|nr:acetyl-CoA acetyltransferase [Pseudomonadaceae bacterium]